MKFQKMLKCCLNPRVIVGIGAVIVLAYVFAPHLLKHSGFLVFLICPLSMVLMMAMMNKGHGAQDAGKDDAKQV